MLKPMLPLRSDKDKLVKLKSCEPNNTYARPLAKAPSPLVYPAAILPRRWRGRKGELVDSENASRVDGEAILSVAMLSLMGELSRDLRCHDMFDELEEDDDKVLLLLLLLLLRNADDDIDEDNDNAAEQNF